jgi:hypothetical protein
VNTDEKQQIFKVDDCISFERVIEKSDNVCGEKGTIVLTVRDPLCEGREQYFEIPPNIWASLVLSMSAFGERPNDWHAFMAYHQGEQDMLHAAKTVQSIKNVVKADGL